jgi:hypothetical protein
MPESPPGNRAMIDWFLTVELEFGPEKGEVAVYSKWQSPRTRSAEV